MGIDALVYFGSGYVEVRSTLGLRRGQPFRPPLVRTRSDSGRRPLRRRQRSQEPVGPQRRHRHRRHRKAKLDAIRYRALTQYFVSSAGYPSARAGTLQAAADLYGNGSVEYQTAARAWPALKADRSIAASRRARGTRAGPAQAGRSRSRATLPRRRVRIITKPRYVTRSESACAIV